MQACRDIGDGRMRAPGWDDWIRRTGESQRVRAGAECEESCMRGGKELPDKLMLEKKVRLVRCLRLEFVVSATFDRAPRVASGFE